MQKQLHQSVLEEFGKKVLKDYELPPYLSANLNPYLSLRPYQIEAFKYFIHYWEKGFENKAKANAHLLFQMATGSGKTLVMAGLILYLYQQGYRNFLFFVNSKNIIEKTKDNFLNAYSKKYLFAQNINLSDKNIKIQVLDNFQDADPKAINIVFSTIQGLHANLNTPKENALNYEDFEDKKIVLISDEAHHISADTKKKSQTTIKNIVHVADEKDEALTWEQTVNRIFKANTENILLEFTATANLNNADIAEKYADKLIFDYPLKQFRIDKYSKEVKVLQADLPAFERALQAVLLSQYRLKLLNIKPVILFKSKTIKDSEAFLAEFVDKMNQLNIEDLNKIRHSTYKDPIIQKALAYFAEKMSDENLILELKHDFSPEKLVSVNSKEESEEKQIIVNTLEEANNEYRGVFAVDKLNEGWDVLNLFDIVRLYNTRDAKAGKPGKTTVQEAQLIGRGARYCPFKVQADQALTQRKYDEDLENPLRICEELYYHSAYNSEYIAELNKALIEIGMKDNRSKTLKLELKDSFKNSELYQKGYIFLNEQKKYNREDVQAFSKTIHEKEFTVELHTGRTHSHQIFQKTDTHFEKKTKTYSLLDIDEKAIYKKLQQNNFYTFDALRQNYFPHLSSLQNFVTDPAYLAGIKHIKVSGFVQDIEKLSKKNKLYIVQVVLHDIEQILKAEHIEYKGTEEFTAHQVRKIIHNKTISFTSDEDSDKEAGKSMNRESANVYRLDLTSRDWFVFKDCFGTSEEKLLIRYINEMMQGLSKKYDTIHLVRNERHFKIFNFDDGRAFEPDFVLFLKHKKDNINQHYQIFIEPKGKHLLQGDAWKEKFLLSLKEKHYCNLLWENKEYLIWGLPFYNELETKVEFSKEFEQLL